MSLKKLAPFWLQSKIPFILMGILCANCELFKIKENQKPEPVEEKPVARVLDQYLAKDDLTGVVSKNLSEADSIKRVELYIKNWIKKQLMIAEAASKINFDEKAEKRRSWAHPGQAHHGRHPI